MIESQPRHQIGSHTLTHSQERRCGTLKRMQTGIGWEGTMILQWTQKCSSNRMRFFNSSRDICLNKGVMLRFVHFSLSKCLSVYLIFGAYLIGTLSSGTWTSCRLYQTTPAIVLQLAAITHLLHCFHCFTMDSYYGLYY